MCCIVTCRPSFELTKVHKRFPCKIIIHLFITAVGYKCLICLLHCYCYIPLTQFCPDEVIYSQNIQFLLIHKSDVNYSVE